MICKIVQENNIDNIVWLEYSVLQKENILWKGGRTWKR